MFKSAFQPDGFNYLVRAIDLGGITEPKEIKSILSALYPSITQQFSSFSTAISETLDARPLYPLITSLFLKVNYQIAPLVGPILAWISLILIIFHLSKKSIEVFSALSLLTLFASSFYMRFNFIATTTDALSGLFFFFFVYNLLSNTSTTKRILFLNLSLILCIFTRPVDPIILTTMIFYLYSRRKFLRKVEFFPILIVLLHMVYLEVYLHQFEMGSVNTGGATSDSMFSFLVDAIIAVPKILLTELAFICTNDITLLALLGVSFILVLRFGSIEDRLVYAGITLSTFFLASLNGTIGSGFRYEIPIVMCSIVIWIKHGHSKNLVSVFKGIIS